MADNENKEILHPRQNNKTNREKREQEQKQVKLLKTIGLIVGIVVAVCIIAGLIIGIINKPSRQTVATVGNEKITLEEFQSAVRMQRANINSNYQYLEQLYAMFGMSMDESTRENYAAQMSDSYKGIIGQSVLSNLVDQRIMAYGAAQEGISVSDDEVETYYQSLFGYYPNGTPTASPTNEPFEATPTVTDEQLAILRYTETPLPTDIPTEEPVEETVEEAVEEEIVEDLAEGEDAEEIVEETAAEIESEVEDAVSETAELIEEVLSEPTEVAEPTLAPTPTVFTEDMFKTYETYYFANNYYYSKDFFKSQLRYELLQDKVEEMVEAGVARTADMVWARHILVETEEEAVAALDRINEGEEWADVAAELSLDTATKDNGGDLGWFTEGTMVQAFNDAAFSQEVGTISDPVQTDYGYHLIQVIAHEDHPYTSSEFDEAVELAYQNWLSGYESQLEISMIDNIADKTPTDPEFVG